LFSSILFLRAHRTTIRHFFVFFASFSGDATPSQGTPSPCFKTHQGVSRAEDSLVLARQILVAFRPEAGIAA